MDDSKKVNGKTNNAQMIQGSLDTVFRDTWNVLIDEAKDEDNNKRLDKFILISILDLFLLKRHPKAYKYYLRYVKPIILKKLSERETKDFTRTYIPYREQAGCSKLSGELFSKHNLENGKEELFVSKLEKTIENQVPSALIPFQKFVKPHIEIKQHTQLPSTEYYRNIKTALTSNKRNRSESSSNSTKRPTTTIEPAKNQNYHSSSKEDIRSQIRPKKSENVSLGKPTKSGQEQRMPHKYNTKDSNKGEEEGSRKSSGRCDKRNDERNKQKDDNRGTHTKRESKGGRNPKSAQSSTEQKRTSERNSRAHNIGSSRSKKDSHSKLNRNEKREERKKPKPPPGYPSAPQGYPTLPAGYPNIGSSSSTGNGNSTSLGNHQSPPPGYPGASSPSTPGFSGHGQHNQGTTSTELGTPCPPCLLDGYPLLNGKVAKVVGTIKEKINDPELQQQAHAIQKQAQKFISKQAKKLLERK